MKEREHARETMTMTIFCAVSSIAVLLNEFPQVYPVKNKLRQMCS